MKLLTKSEQLKAKALERNREVQEGLKLAKRVDGLREISAQEDKALKDFRKSTLEQISKEISEVSQKRDALVGEVKILENRKEEALKSLDSEWERVKSHEIEVSRKEEAILSQIDGINVQQKELSERLKAITDKEAQIETIRSVALDQFNKSDVLLKQAENDSRIASNMLQEAHEKSKAMLIKAEEHNGFILEREKAVFKKEEELRAKEIELAKQERVLKDKYATLERSIKRLNK